MSNLQSSKNMTDARAVSPQFQSALHFDGCPSVIRQASTIPNGEGGIQSDDVFASDAVLSVPSPHST